MFLENVNVVGSLLFIECLEEGLVNDTDKIENLCNAISSDFCDASLISCSLFGKARNELSQVKFNRLSERNTIFFSQKRMRVFKQTLVRWKEKK